MQPVVSIIIPMYNAAQYIDCALDSATNQTYDDFEIVVIDDGSTDDSAKIVQANQDPRVRYFRQDNQGQSAAINFGVKHSTGKFIKLLDADDWLNPSHLECQIDAMGASTDKVSSCRWGYFVDDYRTPAVRKEFTNSDYDSPMQWIVDSLTKDEGMMGGWMWLIPRRIWHRAGGYDTRLSLNNDFHFSIKLLLASNGIRHAAEAIYSYRAAATGTLSVIRGKAAMQSAFLTTELGTGLLMQHQDTAEIRRICADRWKSWLFEFYPEFPDLAKAAEAKIESLGGSQRKLQGGRLLKLLRPVIGWKGVRQIQSVLYRFGWQRVLEYKARKRLSRFQ